MNPYSLIMAKADPALKDRKSSKDESSKKKKRKHRADVAVEDSQQVVEDSQQKWVMDLEGDPTNAVVNGVEVPSDSEKTPKKESKSKKRKRDKVQDEKKESSKKKKKSKKNTEDDEAPVPVNGVNGEIAHADGVKQNGAILGVHGSNPEDTTNVTSNGDSKPAVDDTDAAPAKKEKKHKKKKSKPDTDSAPNPAQPDDHASGTDDPESKDHRFIVFVGQLPYETTDADISHHFASIHPDQIRHITHKKPSEPTPPADEPTADEPASKNAKRAASAKHAGQSKGYAYLEFSTYDRMRTCLQRYHHSMFSASALAAKNKGKGKKGGDAHPKALSMRRINVELTAGGGGVQRGEAGEVEGEESEIVWAAGEEDTGGG